MPALPLVRIETTTRYLDTAGHAWCDAETARTSSLRLALVECLRTRHRLADECHLIDTADALLRDFDIAPKAEIVAAAIVRGDTYILP